MTVETGHYMAIGALFALALPLLFVGCALATLGAKKDVIVGCVLVLLLAIGVIIVYGGGV